MDNNKLPDFDTLKDLVENSPEEVERILQDNIKQIYARASKAHLRRLKGLQFQLDAQRRLAKNPMDACIRMSRMMHDSLIQLNDALNRPAEKR